MIANSDTAQRVRQVAEVDDAVGVHGAADTARHDDVGVGQVQMRRLPGQAVGERRVSATTRLAAASSTVARCDGVGDVRKQLRHNVGAVLQIPLQGAVQPGMVESGQRAADPARHFAKARDGRRAAGSRSRTACRRADNRSSRT